MRRSAEHRYRPVATSGWRVLEVTEERVSAEEADDLNWVAQ